MSTEELSLELEPAVEIETGRWNRIDRNLRICKNCALNEVEDENHFLFDCPMYVNERNDMINTIKAKTNVDISKNLTYEEKLNNIFAPENVAILNAFGKFIKISSTKREKMTCNINVPNFVHYGINI